MHSISNIEVITRVAVAVLFGISIGIERQWQTYSAELQTYALVTLGSAVFVLFSAYAFSSNGGDPRRVAAQIVTGIGFLCGGVILKQGATILGLNTAATIWASAAVGSLCGAGMLMLATISAVAIVATNLLVKPMVTLIGRRKVRYRGPVSDFLLEIDCDTDREATVRDELFTEFRAHGFRIHGINTSTEPGPQLRMAINVSAISKEENNFRSSIERLSKSPGVRGTRWSFG